MSVNSYLSNRASDAVLSSDEKESINRSISTLQTRLNSYFGTDLSKHFRFGSSTRETILPRKMDSRSDIDYMIVFASGGYTPQTYLNRLKKFAETYYSTSEIKQSSPSIILELNHIKFDLVPALDDPWGAYKIPNGPQEWQPTNPNDFNDSLVQKNKDNHYLIKPTIRLFKYWNAQNGYIFDSFALEKWIINQGFYYISLQKEYLFAAFDNLGTTNLSQTSKDKVERAKAIVKEVRKLESDGYPNLAESEVKKLIPE